MKMFLIADNTDTFAGMRLAGVDGIIVHTDEEFLSAFNGALKDSDVGVIMIMDSLYAKYSDVVMEKKLEVSVPLIVSIPERNKKAAITRSVSSYIESAIGMKIE